MTTRGTRWDESYQSYHFQMASGNFRLSGVVQFQSKHFLISIYLKMFILMSYFTTFFCNWRSAVTHVRPWRQGEMMVPCGEMLKKIQFFNFLIDMLYWCQGCAYRAWYWSITARTHVSLLSLGWAFNGWRGTQDKNEIQIMEVPWEPKDSRWL